MTAILVATDLSPRADRAVGRAFRLAAEHGADLTVVSVIDGDLPERLSAPLVREAEVLLSDFCGAQIGAGDVSWTSRVDTGDVTSDLHTVADEIGAELIVLGLHRTRALFDSFRETTVEHLVRTATRPVLLVAGPADHPYERAIAAIDASPAATVALKAARRWMPDAEIFAFHAVYTGLGRASERDPAHVMAEAQLREARRQLRLWADAGGLPEGVAMPEAVDGALGAVFASEIVGRSAQLAILGAHARHGLAHRLLGGFAREIIRDPPCDLLIGKPA